MAVFRLQPNGAGESTGDQLATDKPLYTTGDIWYVDSSVGVDAVSPAGKNRSAPLATLGQAVSNASGDDIIVLADGHAETLTSVLTINKSVSVVGAGSSSGNPTAKLTINASAASLLSITAASVELRNIWFEESAQPNSSVKVAVSGATFRMAGCYFEADGNDDATCLSLDAGADDAVVEETTFISTSTDVSSQPESAMKTAAVSNLSMKNVTFSGGSVGWSNHYAFDGNAAATTYLRAEGISLLLGADMRVNSTTQGWVNVQTSTGGAGLVWDNTSASHWPNGLGETTGDFLVTCKPLMVSGDVWFVNSEDGADAAGTAGQNRSEPLETLAQAHTNAANGDIIVLMDGHNETLPAAQSLSKDIIVVGGGLSGGKPTVKFLTSAAAASLFTVSGNDVELRNLWLEENVQANSASRVAVTSTRFAMVGCYVECNQNDDAVILNASGLADVVFLDSTTFISTSVETFSVPRPALSLNSLSLAMLTGVVLDGGEKGWDLLQAALATSVTSYRASGLSLLRGSDMSFEDTVSGGWLTIPVSTGSCRILCSTGGA